MTKISPTLSVLIGAGLVFLLSPYFPNTVLGLLVGNKVGAAIVLIATLYMLRKNIVLGLAVFLAAAALFLENRRRIVSRVQVTMSAGTATGKQAPVEVLMEPAAPLVRGEVHPSAEEGGVQEHGFEPSEGSGSNEFESPFESMNEKRPLETAPPHPEEVGEFFQERGLARVVNSSNAV
jgi:hypothetical protein